MEPLRYCVRCKEQLAEDEKELCRECEAEVLGLLEGPDTSDDDFHPHPVEY